MSEQRSGAQNVGNRFLLGDARSAHMAWRILLACGTVLIAGLLRWSFSPWVGDQRILILFLPAVMVSTWYVGIGPGLFALGLSTIAGDSTAAHPLSFLGAQKHQVVYLGLFVLVGFHIAVSTELLHRRTREVQAASRAKDHFIHLLSHELRTPLTPALLASAVLADDAGLSASLREQMKLIERNLSLEARLIDDLLDIGRIQKGKLQLHREVVDVETIVREAFAICFQDIAGKYLHIQVHVEGKPHAVNADPVRLEQVFWNLMRNAIKFTPDGGSVSIKVAGDNTKTVSIEITDTGIGIAKERLPRIFDAFEQADESITRQFGGLGLGLAIARALVEMQGGTIEASSEGLGRGTTFIVKLPVSEVDVAEPVNRPLAKSSRHDLRILYVEDHSDTRQAMVRVLQRMGHSVTAVASIDAALKSAQHDRFDLLISDLSLPDGDGVLLLGKLRDIGSVTLGVALSGHGMEEDICRTRAAGYSAHLTKPIEPSELESTIASLAQCA